MNDLAKTPQPQQSVGSSAGASALTLELAKMLVIVAPVTMTTEQREIWLRGAVDALEGIQAHEVAAISAELRRSVTRHNQIVPEIAKLVSERRKWPTNGSSLDAINAERVKEGYGAVRWVKRNDQTVCELVDPPVSSMGKSVA